VTTRGKKNSVSLTSSTKNIMCMRVRDIFEWIVHNKRMRWWWCLLMWRWLHRTSVVWIHAAVVVNIRIRILGCGRAVVLLLLMLLHRGTATAENEALSRPNIYL
jgi:hypothetical protein